MTIADGSWVAPATILGPATTALLDGTPWLAQPPHVGIASGAQGGPPATTVDVLWDTGFFDTTLPVGTLQELQAAQSSTVAQFSGQVVRRTVNNQSGQFIGVPVLLARIIYADQSPADIAIVKTLGPAAAYWVAPTSEIEVVSGR